MKLTNRITDCNNPFTMAEALHCQERDLKRWGTVLKQDVLDIVKRKTVAETMGVEDPYDVPRGDWITQFVVQLSYDLSRE